MNSFEDEVSEQSLIKRVETYLRENPAVAILGAVTIGFAVGLLSRAIEPERKSQPIHDAVDEVRAMLKPWKRKTRRAYAASSDTIREAIDRAVATARNIDVEQYVHPLAKWWKRVSK